MTTERWRRLQSLYLEILAKPAGDRELALASACPDDPQLAAEVRSLLEQPDSSGLLASPVLEVAAGLMSGGPASMVGRRIGAFEVQGLLGVGGMGEVYRGRDTRLGRAVAIKILPAAFKDDADRAARFEREARLLASLSHPNIGAVFGLEDAGDQKALVMELVEGEDLSGRIARGPIPVPEALSIARQIAEGIEAAHEQGVIHRDLKPANIKVRPDGKVKVLDFGLALAMERRTATDPTESPTLTARATRAGMIMGTAAYMAPEQAGGRPVDRRADVWSFGVVLYEMLTGERAFKGDDVASTLASVLRDTPSLERLPAAVPARIRRLLERCLERDPRTRLRDIGEARVEIARIEAGGAEGLAGSSPGPPRSRIVAPALAIAAALAALIAVGVWVRPSEPSAPEVRLTMPLGPDLQYPGIGGYLALAPDGRTAAYSASKGPGVGQQSLGGEFYLRKLDEPVPTPLAQRGTSPFFSPDGQWLAFFDEGKLKKIPVAGGAAVEIATCGFGDGDWGAGDVLVFGDSTDRPTEGIRWVSSSGGPVSVVTRLDLKAGQSHHLAPQLLPGGKAVLFTIRSDGPKFQLAVVPIAGGVPRVIAEDALFGRYLGEGTLIFQRGTTLLAARFDEGDFTLGGGVPVLSGVHFFWRSPTWALSTGTLIYRPVRDETRTLLWVGRDGVAQPVGAPPQFYSNPRLSPRGDRISAAVERGGTLDVWTYDPKAKRLQMEVADGRGPVWAPDGAHLLVHRRSAISEIFSLRLDGSGVSETLLRGAGVSGAAFMTSDGQTLVYHDVGDTTGYDIMATEKGTKGPRPLVRTPMLEAGAQLHPDGRWMAYATNVNGRNDIFVTPFPEAGARVPVTVDGGREPIWSRDGRELFYRQGSRMFSAALKPGAQLAFDPPQLLFDVPYFQSGGPGFTQYDVGPDGRFLMLKAQEIEAPYWGVILNWTETLQKAVRKP